MVDVVSQWLPAGIIILWTYHQQNPNYFGWHLTADPVGCKSVIDLLDRMATMSYPVKRTIPLTCPQHFPFSEIPNPYVWSDLVIAEKLQLSYSASLPTNTWEAQVVQGVYKLSIGAYFLTRLRAGIVDISNGDGDYSIGPEERDGKPEDNLWFWWYCEPKRVQWGK